MTARTEDLADLPDWPRLMSAEQAGRYLGVSAPTMRRTGIRPVRIGGRVLYDRADLDAWVDAQKATPAGGGIDLDAAIAAI